MDRDKLTADNMTEPEKAVLWVLFYIAELKEKGLASGGPEITDEGRRLLATLTASGWKLTDEQVKVVLRHLMQPPIAT